MKERGLRWVRRLCHNTTPLLHPMLNHTQRPSLGASACNQPVKRAGQASPIMSRDRLCQLVGDGAQRDGIAGPTLSNPSQAQAAQLLPQGWRAHAL